MEKFISRVREILLHGGYEVVGPPASLTGNSFYRELGGEDVSIFPEPHYRRVRIDFRRPYQDGGRGIDSSLMSSYFGSQGGARNKEARRLLKIEPFNQLVRKRPKPNVI